VKNLFEEAQRCFLLTDPDEKIEATREVAHRYLAGKLDWQSRDTPIQYKAPGRLDKPQIVTPRKAPKRGFNSPLQRARLLHALTHIELTAVNLAWDTIYRFREMPKAYYDDWAQTAIDEANHFIDLRTLMRQLDFDYGDFNVHDEIWNAAVQTSGDIMDRMAVVHRVLEARALDIVPQSIDRFTAIGEHASARALTTIANDEVAHVSAGSRWFRYRCEQEGLDADSTFFKLVKQYTKGYAKGPFNLEIRREAGFSENELSLLESYALEQREALKAN